MKVTKRIRSGLFAISSTLVLAMSALPMAAVRAEALADTQAPTITIVSPASGSTLKKNTTVNITVNASDDVGVTQIDYTVRSTAPFLPGAPCGIEGCESVDVLVCTGTATTCAWHLPNARGSYEITATAYDAAMNTGTSSVLVTVR